MGFPKWGIWDSLKENILFQKKKKKEKKSKTRSGYPLASVSHALRRGWVWNYSPTQFH